jgi:hypothetical protein
MRAFASTAPRPPGGGPPIKFEPATSNYVGSLGFFYGRQCVPATGLACNNVGIFYIGSEVAIKDITDGTSHTLLLGERDDRCNAASWIGTPNPPDINHLTGYFQVATTLWGVSQPERPKTPPPFVRYCDAAFSSAHVGGANFAMADASIRFISDEIDFDDDGCPHDVASGFTPTFEQPYPPNWPECNTNSLGVLHRLGSRNDGLVINESF